MEAKKTNYGALITITTVFFFWGFVAASNDILIPVFKNHLNLEQWQSQLISFAFYIAYTVGSILYIVISAILKKDILNKIGYKNGVALGLIISALGTLLFIPAANNESFVTMITGLFIVGLGFSLQQTAANPLTINMGDPKTGSQRLSMAGGINNLGTTIGPVLLSLAIFGSVSSGNTTADIQSIKIPYLILGLAFVIVAVIFKFSKIPNQLQKHESDVSEESSRKSAFAYPQLILGMIAIFVYVGVEVATAGNLSDYLQKNVGIDTNKVAPYVSLFWASLMIGRWTSAAGAFNLSKNMQLIFGFILPYVAFGIFMGINAIIQNDITPFKYYFLVIAILILADLASKGNPARQLLIFSFLGITALLIGMFTTGIISVYAFISVGLFCSTLWPCIFTLAIKGLGKHTNQGSGFLIMMIMGGGFISLLQGLLADDKYLGIQNSYIVGVFCFVYLAIYAFVVPKILKKQGVSLD
ncbi:MAG: MFS transporter [Flavobacteriia bacterium]|jgi:FHS family L-fucose permease-like MFS transporter